MLEVVKQICPYCGEPIELVIDCSVPTQTYIEDCQVCCRPITIKMDVSASELPEVQLFHEDD